MDKGADIFWKNVKKEIKLQNTTHEWVAKHSGIKFGTFQGWILNGLYPRVDDAARIAKTLNTSIEYLLTGALAENKNSITLIYDSVQVLEEYVEIIKSAIKDIK
jgi:transcriptional regulator with XRE-family HTH domain